MHSQAVALWKAGAPQLSARLRRAADRSSDFLSFWAALENNFGASETSDVLLVGIAKFRDKINEAAVGGNIGTCRLTEIVDELAETAETEEEIKYWQAFELPSEVNEVSLEELGLAVIDYLEDTKHQVIPIDELPSPVAADQDSILPMLRQIKEDVACLKATTLPAVQIKQTQNLQSSRSESTLADYSTVADDFLLTDRKLSKKKMAKPWKCCSLDVQQCLLQ